MEEHQHRFTELTYEQNKATITQRICLECSHVEYSDPVPVMPPAADESSDAAKD